MPLPHLDRLHLTLGVRRPVQRGGFVYLIEGGGAVKVGYSRNPQARLRTLQSACPFSLKLLGVRPGTLADEAALHRRLVRWRVSGEWFRDCAEVRQALDVELAA